MHKMLKYTNIKDELPELAEVLLNTIQSDILEIKKIDKCCKKFNEAVSKMPKLRETEYVVFSKYMGRDNHTYEKFIFLSKNGREIFDAAGIEMELYGMITATNLIHTPEYKAFLKSQK